MLRLKRRKNQIDTLDPIVGQLQFYFCLVSCTRNQGPKLTFLGRRQLTTEIFFSVAIWKNVVAKVSIKFWSYFFVKKISLSRRVGYVMHGSMGERVSE